VNGPHTRVLHLGNGNLYGGIERLLVSLALMQQRTAVLENHFLLSHEGRLSRELQAAGVQPMVLEPTRISRPWTVLRARKRVKRAVEALRPDVVVSHGAWTHAVLGEGVPHSTPLVFYCHNPVTRNWLHGLAARRSPEYVLANSEFTRRSVNSLFPAVESAVVTYVLTGSVAGCSKPELRADLAAPGDLVILQVSRLERWKGHTLLVDAAEELVGMPGWRIWFVGGAQRSRERQYEAELRARTRGGALSGRVSFLGERSDVADVLATADVFCQPNLEPEAFGLVFVEAMAAGRPIVTTLGGGPAEFLSDDFSILVPPEPRPLADALRRLLTNPKLRDSMGAAAAQSYGSRFDPLRATEELAEALLRVTSRREWP
jgi:glycosyltransferase involved in cell wall biosynthesis